MTMPEKGTKAWRFNRDDAWKAMKASTMASITAVLLMCGEQLVTWLNQLPQTVDFGPYAPLAYGICGFIATAIVKLAADTRRIELKGKPAGSKLNVTGKSLSLFCVVLILPGMIGCASMQEDLTPTQRIYALQSEYNTVASIAADYCESDGADAEVKATIKTIDKRMYELIQLREPVSEIASAMRIEIEKMSAVIKETWRGEERK